MRLFRKKDSPEHQEYLDGLISSIRQARRKEEEEKPGLHAFVEADYFPGEPPGPPKVPPGVAEAGGGAQEPAPSDEADAVADLEAYLSALNAAESETPDEDEPGERSELA